MENWIDILSDPAVTLASRVWNKGEAETWGILSRSIQNEEVSQNMPAEQFRQYIKLIADPEFFKHCPICKTTTSTIASTCSNCRVNLEIARNNKIEEEFNRYDQPISTEPTLIHHPTSQQPSSLSKTLVFFGNLISIVGGSLAFVYSVYTAYLLFGWLNALVALVFAPVTYFLLPFYTFIINQNPILLILNYGVGITASILIYIGKQKEPSPKRKLLTISSAIAWVLLCGFLLFAYIWVKDLYIMPFLNAASAPTSTPKPTIVPAVKPAKTATPNTSISLAFPECYHWSKVTPTMKGKDICVFGIVYSFYPTNETSTRINFTEQTNSFFIYDINYIYPDIEPGWCILVKGKVELYQYTPFIEITEGISGGYPPKPSDCQ